MDYLVQDYIGLFKEPKDTFRRIITYESLKAPAVLLFICGIIMGLRRYVTAYRLIPPLPQDQTPFAFGLVDAEYFMAFIMPIMVVVFWAACSFIIHAIAEKLGSMKGEFNEVLMASGYLSYPLLTYLILSFPLFYMGKARGVAAMASLDNIVAFLFVCWMFFLITQLLESVCELPMAYGAISIILTFVIFAMLYYGFIEMFLAKILVANFCAGRHQ